MNGSDPLFQSSGYDFELFSDGSWKCWSDGKVMADGAFSRRDLSNLAETAIRVEQSKLSIHDMDRKEPH